MFFDARGAWSVSYFSGLRAYWCGACVVYCIGMKKLLFACIAILIGIFIHGHMTSFRFEVATKSMLPAYQEGQRYVFSRSSVYERGDTVAFRYPFDDDLLIFKRIIGLPGDTVEVSSGRITIYNNQSPEGFELSEPYVDPSRNTDPQDIVKVLRDNEYYVVGDNRDHSSDSRAFGPVSEDLLIARHAKGGWTSEYYKLLMTIVGFKR